MSAVKERIGQAVDHLGPELEELSRQIHDHPELGYQEVKAAGWLCEFLQRRGCAVERGVAGVATAFRATISTGAGPTVAILCEYDALPQIGHACGHNIIATSGAGAGAALAAVRDQLPPGTIHVIGTPAEEGGAGKVKLLRAGVFADVAAVMMIHGWDRWVAHQDLLGVVRLSFEFRGKAAHAAADPWEGINALDGVIQTFNNISMLRQQIRPDARIHGIVTSGGAAANIIPESAACLYYVRATTMAAMKQLQARVTACAQGAAQATGCELAVTELDNAYEPMKKNDTLLGVFKTNWTFLGIPESPPLTDRLGSSDIGNISQALPAIQPLVKIVPEGTPIHTRTFAEAAVQPLAHDGMRGAAKALAMTAYDLLATPALLKEAQREFERTRT